MSEPDDRPGRFRELLIEMFLAAGYDPRDPEAVRRFVEAQRFIQAMQDAQRRRAKWRAGAVLAVIASAAGVIATGVWQWIVAALSAHPPHR